MYVKVSMAEQHISCPPPLPPPRRESRIRTDNQKILVKHSAYAASSLPLPPALLTTFLAINFFFQVMFFLPSSPRAGINIPCIKGIDRPFELRGIE
jgi:hypothetical protein